MRGRRLGRPRFSRHARDAGEDHDGLAAVAAAATAARGQAPIPLLSRARAGRFGLARDGSSSSSASSSRGSAAVARCAPPPPAPAVFHHRVSGLGGVLPLRPVGNSPSVMRPVSSTSTSTFIVLFAGVGPGFAVALSAVGPVQPASGPQHVHYLLLEVVVPGRDRVAGAMVDHGVVYCGSRPTTSCEDLSQPRSFVPGGHTGGEGSAAETDLPLNNERLNNRYHTPQACFV